jgi:hypothetical protein
MHTQSYVSCVLAALLVSVFVVEGEDDDVEMDRGRLLWFGTLECLKLAEFRGLEVA